MINKNPLVKFAWLSVLAALATIALKTFAYYKTGSVGLMSDALESSVNLIGALMAVAMLTIASKPADEDHPFGHSKAEYFSSLLEGLLISIAALLIMYTAVGRLFNPRELEEISLGVVMSVIAALINLGVGLLLLKAGKNHNSITLTSNAKHLLTDVWTTVGVIIALIAVPLTGIVQIDPVIALLIAGHILWTGGKIMMESINGLMDVSLPPEEIEQIKGVLQNHLKENIHFHALLTRKAGADRFASFHAVVPGEWTVKQGHDLVHQVEDEIKDLLPNINIISHLEPIDCPTSWDDVDFGSAIQKTSGDFHCEERNLN